MHAPLGLLLFALALLPGAVAAESLDDFTNNLFTDLAPCVFLSLSDPPTRSDKDMKKIGFWHCSESVSRHSL